MSKLAPKLGGTNKKGPGLKLKGEYKSGAWGKKGTKSVGKGKSV